MNIIDVSDNNFEDKVINNIKPVLVDFWAEWCGPCKIIGPILEELSEEKRDQIIIAKMNVDENKVIPSKYGIRGIPTLMIFKNNSLLDTKVGASSKSSINEWIDSVI
ncbi:MAG: Thioredoxin-1 [Alphaproteobacteria bacterium MarineAlpha5_Bin12]|nr:MAG: Thioredoxin-1 [Alphaproteobacteria bacterium MarineAlpha5_Bin12]|tara:strand:+ start:6243 stop:6563 length:321 start_codon:yes stop_codon:yes gene_type:complete